MILRVHYRPDDCHFVKKYQRAIGRVSLPSFNTHTYHIGQWRLQDLQKGEQGSVKGRPKGQSSSLERLRACGWADDAKIKKKH